MSNMDPLIGKRLGDYLIEGIVGTGGMARVYRGYDEKLDRYAAVKVIEPHLIASEEDAEYSERFQREARAIARLNHPHIVGVYQFGEQEAVYYIAMAHIEGRNLREILKSHLKANTLMPVDEMMKILKSIADALDYAHRNSIIHRDVKPSNIIVTGDHTAVLTDFGLALNAIEGTIGNTFGSVHYIAPEQAISSAQAVPQSDQYSLGVIAYEMLTGRVPFDDKSTMSVALKHISDAPPPLSEINPKIPPAVEAVIMRTLDKDHLQRFSTCADFVEALNIAFNTEGAEFIANPPTPAEMTQPRPPEKINPIPSVSGSATAKPVQTVHLSRTTDNQNKSRGLTLPLVAGIGLVAVIALAMVIILPQLGAEDDVSITQTAEAVIAQAIVSTNTAEANARQTIDAAIQSTYAAATEASQVTPTVEPTPTSQPTATPDDDTARQTSIAEQRTARADAIISTSTAQAVDVQAMVQVEDPTDAPEPTATVEASTEEATEIEQSEPDSTDTPAVTPTPDIGMSASDTAQILIRYNSESAVLYNRDNSMPIFPGFYSFIRIEPSGREVRYEMTEWGDLEGGIEPEQCLQVWKINYRSLPIEEPPADICASRLYFRSTARPFWTSSNASAYFEVRWGNDLLATCPVATEEDQDLRCTVAIP